jgi:hypothetical protein
MPAYRIYVAAKRRSTHPDFDSLQVVEAESWVDAVWKHLSTITPSAAGQYWVVVVMLTDYLGRSRTLPAIPFHFDGGSPPQWTHLNLGRPERRVRARVEGASSGTSNVAMS